MVVIARIKTNLWSQWANIAVDHERAAHEARARLVTAYSATGDTGEITAEVAASLVAIVACAHALDALHAEIAPRVGRPADVRDFAPSGKRRPRAAVYMLDTFRIAFPEGRTWERQWLGLFKHRDNAVHFRSDFADAVPHPVIPVRVAPPNATFTSENAKAGCDLLLAVFTAVLELRSSSEAANRWAKQFPQMLSALVSRRSASPRCP